MASPRVRRLYTAVTSLLFDPREAIRRWRGLPYFMRNAARYARLHEGGSFALQPSELHYTSYERFAAAGSAHGHYFHQDLWAARRLFDAGVREHVDVGSRLDGFVAHVLPFARTTYVDLRPLDLAIAGLDTRQGSILDLPFASDSVRSLSCLHVIEHIGLGRYGDDVDPDGYLRAARELARVVAPGGTLLLGTPVGRERLCFDAHRVFHPRTIVAAFPDLTLEHFALIDDAGSGVAENADFDRAASCEYGCGLFVFRKPGVAARVTA